MGASSRSPSPMTTVPLMSRVSNALRMASTAAWSDSFLVPRPISFAEAIAAISVTRIISSARLRSIRFAPSGQQLHDVVGQRRGAPFPVDARMQRLAGAQNGRVRVLAHLITELDRGPFHLRDVGLHHEHVVVAGGRAVAAARV